MLSSATQSHGGSRAVRATLLALLVAWGGFPPATPARADQRPAQSIKPAGLTVNFAQVIDWISESVFAVGRWDGTISVFRVPKEGEFGPAIVQAMSTPAGRGIEMLAHVDGSTFITSDGPDRLALWHRKASDAPFEFLTTLGYDTAVGTANSGLALEVNGTGYFVSGHEHGHVLVWRRGAGPEYQLVKTLDVRSPNAPSNPWKIHNVRGLAVWRGERVITGSEDGDLVAINLPDGRELFRHRYNAGAQRGINSVSVVGERLLVANCAVGPSDKNTWLYDLSTDHPKLLDAENLVLDTSRAQVFNFDVDLVAMPARPGSPPLLTFFGSTEEGLLWQGRVEDDQLIVSGVTRIAPEGASVMAIDAKGRFVAAATHAVRLFKTD